MKNNEWKLVRNTWVSTKAVLPGVWQRKEGGHVVRARISDPRTGMQKEVWRVLAEASAADALKWLEDERTRIKSGLVATVQGPRERFSEFAAWLFEHKVTVGEIKSAKGRQKWADTLQHLIAETTGKKSKIVVNGLGDLFIDRMLVNDTETWKAGIARLIAAGDYAPTTANTWLAILRVIANAMKRLRGTTLITDGVKDFDESEHETYTEEEPNTLTWKEVGPYLEKFREMYPQHFAMVYLGMITGLRPSTLRPLRRRGLEADVDWGRCLIRVRRSHTLGDEVMRTTKQKRRYPIGLPDEAMEVLQWHVHTQFTTLEQKESDLLFPSIIGGFRSPSVLNKPLADVAREVGLGKKFSQRGLRRAFNDLARFAKVDRRVTRSISGHLTEAMHEHYETPIAEEQREVIGQVIQLFDGRPVEQEGRSRPLAESGEQGGEHLANSGEHKKKAG